jgi:hypothetical protein
MIDRNMTYFPTRTRTRRALLAWPVAAAAAVLPASAALAQEEAPKNDARLEGYEARVQVESGDSTALMWLLLVFLAMVAMGVMFKNAKRTHLD